MNKQPLLKINGAGPTGSILAIALAEEGYEIEIYDPLSSDQLRSRSRSYALTHSSRILLEEINLWHDLEVYLIPFNNLFVQDSVTNRSLLFNSTDLVSRQNHATSIGWIIDHKPLMNILQTAISKYPNINYLTGVRNSIRTSAEDLLIAADGHNSSTRKSLGIGSILIPYRQSCLTAKVLIRGAGRGQAYELFRSEGPLALLPMGRNIFQVIWSAPTDKCQTRANLDSALFLDRLAAILPEGLEPDILLERPLVFPLNLSIASRPVRRNIILIGESAHSCHPVGGQGLNLCWRDVYSIKSLMKLVNKGKLRMRDVPNAYYSLRIIDWILVSLITDIIIRVFSNKLPFLIFIRRIIFVVLSRLKRLRRLLLKDMTYGPLSMFRLK